MFNTLHAVRSKKNVTRNLYAWGTTKNSFFLPNDTCNPGVDQYYSEGNIERQFGEQPRMDIRILNCTNGQRTERIAHDNVQQGKSTDPQDKL